MLATIITIVLVELVLICIVNVQRKSFPWLITKRDDFPSFDRQALQKFIDYSFDSVLGWNRKPNSSGKEKGRDGLVTFHIDKLGSRVNPTQKKPPLIAAFGDSYAFCRQVEDDETWEAYISEKIEYGVLNFGVGNYGVDQALLRYEVMSLPETVRIVIMGFVPETICRIQSCWKHYLEFGNTFAFKPMFKFDDNDRLVFLSNKMKSIDDYENYVEILPEVRMEDRFYREKFKIQQFRFPYILSFLRCPLRHIQLILSVAFRATCKCFGVSSQKIENLPFSYVMKNNLLAAHRLYGESKSTKLLNAILRRFVDEAVQRGHIPLIVVIPQLLDLKLAKGGSLPFQDFFKEVSKFLPVLDLTETFASVGAHESLYSDDQYGGHLSKDGNLLVSEKIMDWLRGKEIDTCE
jgi:hypothetical protein